MPIDYKKYHPEWLTLIRPGILARAENRCEFCGVPNHINIIRGVWHGKEVYQDESGQIWSADDSAYVGEDYVGAVSENGAIRVVLTIAHLDHNIDNNEANNLAALCQKCHLGHDKNHHIAKRRYGKDFEEKQVKLEI